MRRQLTTTASIPDAASIMSQLPVCALQYRSLVLSLRHCPYSLTMPGQNPQIPLCLPLLLQVYVSLLYRKFPEVRSLLRRYVSRAGGKISIERILFIFAPLKSPSPVKRVLCISPRTKLSFFTYLTEFFCAQPFSASVHPSIASGYTKFQRNLIIAEITVSLKPDFILYIPFA